MGLVCLAATLDWDILAPDILVQVTLAQGPGSPLDYTEAPMGAPIAVPTVPNWDPAQG